MNIENLNNLLKENDFKLFFSLDFAEQLNNKI